MASTAKPLVGLLFSLRYAFFRERTDGEVFTFNREKPNKIIIDNEKIEKAREKRSTK